ncbi:MAG: manganese efflux pump [Clostridia bacterium]|nr:manganese efflux pump [Clostridia bacterium]
MLNVIKAFAFALSANIDNLAIGVSYGMKKITISSKINIIIAILMSVITCFTMIVGKSISSFFNIEMINKIGAYALIIIGIHLFISECKDKHTEESQKELSQITFKNILLVILTLSTNNIATGIAASMISINIFFTFIFTIIFSFLMLYIGNKIGSNILNHKIEKYANIISAFIIICLGVFQII